MKIHEMGAAAHLRAAKLKTHLPPHAIQSRKRLQVGGGRGCGGVGGGGGGVKLS